MNKIFLNQSQGDRDGWTGNFVYTEEVSVLFNNCIEAEVGNYVNAVQSAGLKKCCCIFTDIKGIHRCCERLFPRRDDKTRLGTNGGAEKTLSDLVKTWPRPCLCSFFSLDEAVFIHTALEWLFYASCLAMDDTVVVLHRLSVIGLSFILERWKILDQWEEETCKSQK